MKSIVKIACYIEEYKNQSGDICARLRDKESDKRVILTGINVSKDHLLRFLSQAKINNKIMPTVYNRNGSDVVAVRGYIISDTADEIEICIDIENGGYLFE